MKNVVNCAPVAKKKYLLIALLLLSPLTISLSPLFAAKANKQIVVLSCDLHCQGCCDKIMKNIAFEKGVKDIVCDLETKTVKVTFDANKTDSETLLKAFEKIGKPAKVVTLLAPRDSESPHQPMPDASSGASQIQ